MIVTDEPGVYETDEVGIRIENELECYHKADNQYGTFLGFAPLTLCAHRHRAHTGGRAQPRPDYLAERLPCPRV